MSGDGAWIAQFETIGGLWFANSWRTFIRNRAELAPRVDEYGVDFWGISRWFSLAGERGKGKGGKLGGKTDRIGVFD